MSVPSGWANRAVGTALAITNPTDNRQTVVNSSAAPNRTSGMSTPSGTKRRPASAEQEERRRREHQLRDHVSRQDGLRPERRRAQALQDAAFPVDRNDRDERQHRAGGDEQRRQDRQIDRDEARDLGRA